ncbi:MAG: hypothetical protein ACRDOL_24590 [Streptosporangiaceae bacterium]
MSAGLVTDQDLAAATPRLGDIRALDCGRLRFGYGDCQSGWLLVAICRCQEACEYRVGQGRTVHRRPQPLVLRHWGPGRCDEQAGRVLDRPRPAPPGRTR